MCITDVDDSPAGVDVTGLFEEDGDDGSVEYSDEGDDDAWNDDCVDGSVVEALDSELDVDEAVVDELGLELPILLTVVLSAVGLLVVLVS